MTTKPTIEAIAKHDAVYSVKLWEAGKNKRTYISLVGADRGFRGDMTTKVYFDHNRDELVIEKGKGTMTDAFYASLEALKGDFDHVIR